jgi:hypothetical protein
MVERIDPDGVITSDGPVSAPAVPAKSRASEVEELLVNIFELTGQKVTLDDPVVVAALLQSALLKRAGSEAAALVTDATVKVVAELTEAVKVERQQAANLDRTVANAFQQITDGAKKVGDQELTTIQVRFSRMASETLEQVRREAAKRAPGGLLWKLTAMFCGGLAVGVVIGFAVGKSSTPSITNEQVRLMHNGILLDAAWGKLPKNARDLVESSGKADTKPVGETKK